MNTSCATQNFTFSHCRLHKQVQLWSDAAMQRNVLGLFPHFLQDLVRNVRALRMEGFRVAIARPLVVPKGMRLKQSSLDFDGPLGNQE